MHSLKVLLLLLLVSAAVASYSRHLCGRELLETMRSICDEDCSQVQKNRHLKENKTYRKKRETLVRDCCQHRCSDDYLMRFCCW